MKKILLLSSPSSYGEIKQISVVSRVIDGDIIDVVIDGTTQQGALHPYLWAFTSVTFYFISSPFLSIFSSF